MLEILVFSVLVLLLFLIVRKPTSSAPSQPKKQPAPAFKTGDYSPRYPEKHLGDIDEIVFRSGWEKIAFDWCDMNRHITGWASESVKIPYFMKGYHYKRTYYPDLLIRFKDGKVYLVEIKPGAQKRKPNYENRCKWAAARAYCKNKGWLFRIWDETTIEKLKTNVQNWRRFH